MRECDRHLRIDRIKPPLPARFLGNALLSLSAIAFGAACQANQAVSEPPPQHTPILDSTCQFYTNELQVSLKKGESLDDIEKTLEEYGAFPLPGAEISVKRYGSLIVSVDSEKRDELERTLDGHPSVKNTEKSYLGKIDPVTGESFCPPTPTSSAP